MNFFWLTIAGISGIYSRYFFGIWVHKAFPSEFPLGIFLINMIGAFGVGVVYVVGAEHELFTEEVRLALMAGFLGGFTTFSSYCMDCFRLVEHGHFWKAVGYWSVSPILGVLTTFAAVYLTRLCFR